MIILERKTPVYNLVKKYGKEHTTLLHYGNKNVSFFVGRRESKLEYTKCHELEVVFLI